MKKRYEAPLCEVCEMETDGLLAQSGNSLEIDHTASDIAIQGDVNANGGWDLW